jgi:hypothetical protein
VYNSFVRRKLKPELLPKAIPEVAEGIPRLL